MVVVSNAIRSPLMTLHTRKPLASKDDFGSDRIAILAPEATEELLDAGLSHAEMRTLELMLRSWLRGSVSRAALAETLGISEGTVRVRIGSIRAKLVIEGQRGARPILIWLAERKLLAPDAAARALARLARG